LGGDPFAARLVFHFPLSISCKQDAFLLPFSKVFTPDAPPYHLSNSLQYQSIQFIMLRLKGWRILARSNPVTARARDRKLVFGIADIILAFYGTG
jgi:hypothetical protein